jgi:hypothetical protein
VPATLPKTSDAATSPTPQRPRFRFGLRSLFALMAGVGVASGILRSIANGDPAIGFFLLGVAVYCYGGIFAIATYAFVAALLNLSTTSYWAQRTSQIVAVLIAAAAWLGVVILTFGRSPQTCILFSILIVPILIWLVRTDWRIPEGPSPENSLRQLLAAKRNCDHNANSTDERNQ